MPKRKEGTMPELSDKLTIRGKTLKNRIVFLPCVTFSFRGDNGNYFGSQHLAHYTQMAEGGAGVVYVQGTNALGISNGNEQWTVGSRKTLEQIVSAIHAHGALAMIQLSWSGDRSTDLNELSTDELLTRQSDLLEAALVVGDLGFDGLEFHFGHGFLLCKLFDKEVNRRTDRFGGTLENRVSIITDIIPQIRSHNGDDFILSVRMGAYLPDLETGLATARFLEQIDIDVLNITFSMIAPKKKPDDFPLSDMAYGGFLIKQAVGIPVIGVGGIRRQKDAETLIEAGYADLAGIARGILADPAFPAKILAGQSPHECADCKECRWFTDHTTCPARLRAQRQR
jgi:2,4-dienoyl-CoA reductase-like NADH-dependent reductase (Old Yellow Enzyme family)